MEREYWGKGLGSLGAKTVPYRKWYQSTEEEGYNFLCGETDKKIQKVCDI